MSLGRYEKDPDETIDYAIDWSPRLNVAGGSTGTIVTAAHAVPAGLTKVSENSTDSISTVRLSGGTAGTDYKIEVLMTSSDGEVVQEEFYVSVVER